MALQQPRQRHQAGLALLGDVVDHHAVEPAGVVVGRQAAPAGQGILHGLGGQGLVQVPRLDHALAGLQCLQAFLAQDGDQIGAQAAGVHQALHQRITAKAQAQAAQRLGGQGLAGRALQPADGQHLAKIAQGALVVEHGRGIQVPEAGQHEPAAPLLAERAQGGQLVVAVVRLVAEEQVGLVDQQVQALAGVLGLQVVHDLLQRRLRRQAELQRHARRQPVVAQRDVVAHDLRVALQAALHGLEQAALAQLAPAHHQIVGRLAVDHAGQQLLAPEEGALARHAAPGLVGRDARHAQLGRQQAQQHLQGRGRQQPLGLAGAVHHHMQIGAVFGMGAQQGPGGFGTVIAQDEHHVGAGLRGAQLAQHGGFIDPRRGDVQQAAVQRDRQVGWKLPLEHRAGQRPVTARLAAGRHALGQHQGLVGRVVVGELHGALPVLGTDLGGLQRGAQPAHGAQQLVDARQARHRGAQQLLGAQLRRADQRVAQHPHHGADHEDQRAPLDEAAQPGKRLLHRSGHALALDGGGVCHVVALAVLALGAGSTADGQHARRHGRLAGPAGPVVHVGRHVQQHLGAGQSAERGVVDHIGLQAQRPGRGDAQLGERHLGRVLLDVLGPMAQLLAGLHQGHAPLHQLAPHGADALGRAHRSARGGVQVRREQRAADEQRCTCDHQDPDHGPRHPGPQLLEHAASSTIRPAWRTVSQRQCRRAASPVPRTWMRLPQNRRRRSSSCR